MKIRINPGAIPEAAGEHEQTLGVGVDSPARKIHQELEIAIDREPPNISMLNSELIDEIAEDVRVKIDNKIAEKAFLISLRRDFGADSATVDWADRMQTEINKEGNLRTHYSDRRAVAETDRRHKAAED